MTNTPIYSDGDLVYYVGPYTKHVYLQCKIIGNQISETDSSNTQFFVYKTVITKVVQQNPRATIWNIGEIKYFSPNEIIPVPALIQLAGVFND